MREKTNPWVVCGRIFFTLCLAATIVFIFSNSRQVAEVSEARSLSALSTAQELLKEHHFTGLSEWLTDHRIRKLGHYLEYTLEGFWLMLCLRIYTKHFLKHISWPILGGLLTALCDETIQLYTSGRSSQITDVWIDFSGVMSGLLVGFLLLCLFRLLYWLLFGRRKSMKDETQ